MTGRIPIVLLLLLVCLAGCGGLTHTADRPVLVRVGADAITSGDLAHWMTALAPGHSISPPPRYRACVSHEHTLDSQLSQLELRQRCQSEYQALKTKALALLISYRWLTGEARKEGIAVSDREVQQRLAQRQSAYPDGQSEFHEALAAIGRSIPDTEAEIRAELAAQKIRQRLTSSEPKVAPAEIAAYYKRHLEHYRLSEKRDFDIVENLRSLAAAQKLRTELKHHVRGAEVGLKESLYRAELAGLRGEKRIIRQAIFHARLHVVTEPILINGYYFLVNITHIAPARVQPLSEVQDAIRTKLAAEHHGKTLADFTASWQRRWTARTDCARGYMVQSCKQYSGVAAKAQLGIS